MWVCVLEMWRCVDVQSNGMRRLGVYDTLYQKCICVNVQVNQSNVQIFRCGDEFDEETMGRLIYVILDEMYRCVDGQTNWMSRVCKDDFKAVLIRCAYV